MMFKFQFGSILENKFSRRVRMKKRLIFPGKPLAKKKKKKKVLSKLDVAEKSVESTEQSTPPENHDVPDDAEGERIIRKSTRTVVIVRQAERDAIRAALQATMKVSSVFLLDVMHLLVLHILLLDILGEDFVAFIIQSCLLKIS